MIQGGDPLLEASLDEAPLGRGHDARHQVEGKNLLHACVLAIDVERDAHLQQRALGGSLPVEQFAFREVLDVVHQFPGGSSWLAVLAENFVEELIEFVLLESHGKGVL